MKPSLASLVVVVAIAPSWAAEPSEPVPERLLTCADVRDASDRLACFDREITPFVQARRAATPPSQARAAAPPAAAPAAEQREPPPRAVPPPPAPTPSFGQEQLSRKEQAPVREEDVTLRAGITSIRSVGGHAWLLTLDNGQIWRHEDVAQADYLRVGEAVTIRKATLATYRLTRDEGESRNWIRVKRVR